MLKLNKKPTKKSIVLGLLILLAIALAVYLYISKNKTTDAGGNRSRGGAPAVAFVTATQTNVPVDVTALGSVSAAQTVLIIPKVEGDVLKIYFKEGQFVKQGQVLVDLDSRSLNIALQQAQATLQTNRASLENALADQKRYDDLYKQDSIAKQKRDTQTALVKQLQGTVAGNQAAVNSASLQLSYSHIVAPISGRIGLKNIDVGTHVTAGLATGVATITQTSPMFVSFSLPDNYLADVVKSRELGQELVVQAWDKDQKQLLATGKLSAFNNQIDATTNTFKLKAEFSDVGNVLFPNQFVNVKVQLKTLNNAITLPQSAVQVGPKGHYVWLLDEQNKVHNQPVTMGVQQGENVVIIDGLSAGAKIISDGVDRLQEGMQVKPTEKGAASTNSAAPDTTHNSDKAAATAAATNDSGNNATNANPLTSTDAKSDAKADGTKSAEGSDGTTHAKRRRSAEAAPAP